MALENSVIFKRRHVCHLHFESRYHTRSKFLSANAIPTLCLSGSQLRRPLLDVTNQPGPSSENIAMLRPQSNVPNTSQLQNNTLCNRRKAVKKTNEHEKDLAKKIVQLKKQNESYSKRLKKAQKLSTNSAFQNA
ncbi:uncharacterized protein LOC113230138 [Hyposmocoma kahamanoa]|uniref:uncharacterized protein LOC113230138 n=1 Tax=Hyposmocoma kahamanoa TaxID=1477025 RepID=UPI000E6D898B|nr:uncharacterized protein LOC113230138 [Hyposmocoma kahamanoa]